MQTKAVLRELAGILMLAEGISHRSDAKRIALRTRVLMERIAAADGERAHDNDGTCPAANSERMI
jgi:hypothetical protein